jgi:cytochrome c oxidase cbb3-type subunit 4
MSFDYDTLAAFAKSWGLFYLIAMAIAVVFYTFRRSNKRAFDKAKHDILDDDP